MRRRWTPSFAPHLCALAAAIASTGCLAFARGPWPTEPKTATWATVDGVRVRYKDVGEGPAVVLIHGFASSLETWDTVSPVLGKDHRLLSMDLKGFGYSDRPEGDYSPQAEARLVLGLMKQRGIEKAAVVGHSWGSSVALALTLAAPEKVERIALYDAWVYEDQLPTFFLWARAPGVGEALFSIWYDERADERMAFAFYDRERFVTEALAEDVLRSVQSPGAKAAALAATRGQRFFEFEAQYKTVTQPALLLWGREDEVALLPFGERLQKDLRNSRLVVYPRCGHFPMFEQAAASTHDLAEFLGKDVARGLPAAPAPQADKGSPKDEPGEPKPGAKP